ncbi:TSUP family transporter [Sporomusa termitida]|uniref:Probable membrane transporter protein n=1 Tax=Sporomusa termitida TaxID=2377 RepID=A0A517E0F9_9FIRM|nr:TSUP family transporter [Sporomusa termitida]QDR83090.1 putative membrane transporter protein YfcA [Sporomusa termitida]
MDSISPEIILFLLIAGFIAAFIDSVVGGGGLVSLPALMFTGLPPSVVLGTNKLASSLCSITSTISFLRSGKIDCRLVVWLFPLSFIGSVLGAYTVRHIPPEFLKPLVVVLLIVVAIYTILKKDWGAESTYQGLTPQTKSIIALSVLAIGFYDGFFGPGAGSFFIFSFLMLGFDFVVAAGNAKVMNFASNIAAVITFIYLDSVNFYYGFIMGGAMIAGAIAGSQVAIKSGTAYVRPLFISMTSLLIGKQLWDLVMK